jgi:hypothetical protein
MPELNPHAVIRNNHKAAEIAAERHAEILSKIDTVVDLIHADLEEGLKTMERKFDELSTKFEELQRQSVLPSLKTQQAARPSSRE